MVLPSIWPPYTEACLADCDLDVTVIDNTAENRGVAGSWNIGARQVLDEGADWLVSLSAATRFGPHRGLDFLAQLEALPDAWVVESCAPVGWHLIGWHRRCFERIGLFDENHWPAYGEDADWSWRLLVAIDEDRPRAPWVKVEVDAWIAMQGHGSRLAGIRPDYDATWAYHVAKFGGLSGHERFRRPFDDESLPLSWWPVPPDPRSIIGARP